MAATKKRNGVAFKGIGKNSKRKGEEKEGRESRSANLCRVGRSELKHPHRKFFGCILVDRHRNDPSPEANQHDRSGRAGRPVLEGHACEATIERARHAGPNGTQDRPVVGATLDEHAQLFTARPLRSSGGQLRRRSVKLLDTDTLSRFRRKVVDGDTNLQRRVSCNHAGGGPVIKDGSLARRSPPAVLAWSVGTQRYQ